MEINEVMMRNDTKLGCQMFLSPLRCKGGQYIIYLSKF